MQPLAVLAFASQVVDAGDRGAQLETERRVVAEGSCHRRRCGRGAMWMVNSSRSTTILRIGLLGLRVGGQERVHDLVEVAAVRALGRQFDPGLALQTGEAGGVTGAGDAEHARPLLAARQRTALAGLLDVGLLSGRVGRIALSHLENPVTSRTAGTTG